MVGDTALGIIVGADLRAAVARGHHGLALGGDTVKIFLVLHVVQTGTEFGHGPFGILDLGAFLLALHHDSGRDVGETHCGVSGVDALSAGAGSAEKVFADIRRIEFHVEFVCLREDGDRCCGSLDAALGFGLRNPLYAVHTALVFHGAVHAVGAGKLEHHLLVASGSTV